MNFTTPLILAVVVLVAAAAVLLLWPPAEDAGPRAPATGERPTADVADPEPGPRGIPSSRFLGDPAPSGDGVTAVGRFVDETGSPWPRGTVTMRPLVFPAVLPLQPRSLTVEDDGRFRFGVDDVPEGGRREYRVRARASLGACVATIDLRGRLALGTHDLGDIMLSRGPVICAGRVIDTRGRPVSGALMRVRRKFFDLRPTRIPLSGHESTAADGSFELRASPGTTVPEDLSVRAIHSECLPRESQAFKRGDTDVVVEVVRGGAVEGSVLLSGDLEAEDVNVMVRGGHRNLMADLDRHGAFRITGIPPGAVHLEAWLRRDAWEGIKADVRIQLVVEGGITNRDGRIQGIRLPELEHRVRLKVLDASGAPVAGARIRRLGRGGQLAVVSGADGVAVLRPRSLPLNLRIEAFGLRAARLSGVDGPRRVVLRPGIPIRIATDAVPSGVDPPWQLAFHLWRRRPGRNDDLVHANGFPAHEKYVRRDGSIRVSVPDPGQYKVTAFVIIEPSEGGGAAVSLPGNLFTVIDVKDVTQEQTFRFDIPDRVVETQVDLHTR